MGREPQRPTRPITKLLDAARLDLDAASRLLVDPPNVLAANHLQQAAEKILVARLASATTDAAIDEAIRRVIDSQRPYQAFPPELAREFDVIEIRRTWHFDVAIRLY